MLERTAKLLILLLFLNGCGNKEKDNNEFSGPITLSISLDENRDQLKVFSNLNKEAPILTQVAKEDFRPFIHPIVAPDGKGVLTEYSPGHHKHQTGLYWGFTRVNGRDYFHNPGEDHWRKIALNIIEEEGETVAWQTVYELLDSLENPVMTETQQWSLKAADNQYLLSLEWTGNLETDITIGKYDYGGLFLRMPWQDGVNAEVINVARQKNNLAEGQPAMWINVGIQVEGREDRANIAIFDHPENKGYPQKWRVDNQFGIGPAYTREKDWKFEKGERLVLKHQLVIYGGEVNDLELTETWGNFAGKSGMYNTTALWQIARDEGRTAEFLTPEAAIKAMTIKPGYNVNVFAAEPMITQPMAFCWDDKGRLWIAENKDYESRGHGFSNAGNSRILILEDTNGDGQADSKKVFMEGLAFPAAIAVGFDGLYVGAPPNLLFIPDKNGDDVADMDDISILLTGWGIRDRHETLNSLHWGPDGWLYGLQGFATPSMIRKPNAEEKDKLYYHKDPFPDGLLEKEGVEINGGVWRYHPTKDRFEVVAHGFSNPWGIDYDAKGQLIMTACVIPHLWHVVPGGIYHRQGGQHFNPYVYEDIKTITDHSHRSAHGGARIYQSDAFPEEEQGKVFMANIHEHAVLSDILEPKGSGFIGKHGDDFLLANNAQWVGFSMEIGPDGGVYVLDWHDADICGQEVLNSETGRVFRIMPEQSEAVDWEGRYSDLDLLSDLDLIKLQSSKSDWHGRRARGILQKRAANEKLEENTITRLKQEFGKTADPNHKLRLMWTLHQVEGFKEDDLIAVLSDKDPYLRGWAIQLLCEDMNPDQKAVSKFKSMAINDPSPIVRLYLASALTRLPVKDQWDICHALLQHAEDSNDHNLPKMIWFGTEHLVNEDPEKFLQVAAASELPMVTQFMARRAVDGDHLELLVNQLDQSDQNRSLLLEGMLSGMEGRTDLEMPKNWKMVADKLASNNSEHGVLAQTVSELFGDAEATQKALTLLKNKNADKHDREKALQMLAAQQKPELVKEIPGLLEEENLRTAAIRAVAAFDQEHLGKLLLEKYPSLSENEKMEIIRTMSTRSKYGNLLANEIKTQNIPKKDIPVAVARQLHRVVGSGFIEIWGPIEHIPKDEAAYEKYRRLITEKELAGANLLEGKKLFMQSCGSCHQLFGEGSDIGPDLTGSNRQDVDYILLNVLEPSAEIQDAYRMVVIITLDGRTYTGNISAESPRQITLKVVGQGPVIINKSNIQSKEITPVSLMPPGLFESLSEKEVVSLMAYLQTKKQIK
jgi:putative membrane-bound dehydrogenase-like protein